MKQLKIYIPGNEEIVNKKIKEEFTLKNATLYGGYNLFSDYLAINLLSVLFRSPSPKQRLHIVLQKGAPPYL